jgi:26S proteasome regulatory subunit T5
MCYVIIFHGILISSFQAVAVEAGMLALRREALIIKHEDFMEAINVVAAKKKGSLDYYA